MQFQEKDVALDQATNTIELLEGKVAQLEQEVDNSASQILRYVQFIKKLFEIMKNKNKKK